MSRLHLIGNAHIDPVWLWNWSEGLAEVLATFRSALERMNEYPEFRFTASSAAFYEWVEAISPEMFKEIQARVAEGRWEISGGWWIEPDCNIPSGESFARQGLLGQRYFRRVFGRTATVGYCPDSFGHNGMLPQILRKSGLEHYVFMRPMPHEKEGLPGRVFWWQSPDGSRVLTLRLPFTYATWGGDLEDHLEACAKEIQAPLEQMTCFYGVGNHGGGPTIANLETLRRLRQRPDLPELRHSGLEDFFAEVEEQGADLPVVKDDLQHHASGCYAAHSGIKRWNRQSEQALLLGEKLAAIAEHETGLPYPRELGRAWKQVLFNQFHDILAGTSIESAYEDARSQHGEARAIAGRAAAFGLQSLAQAVSIPFQTDTLPFIAFHPHAHPERVPLEIETGLLDGSELVLDGQGMSLAYQPVQAEAQAAGRRRICFLAEMPAVGLQVFRLVHPAEAAAQPTPQGKLLCGEQAGRWIMENDALRVEIDPLSGGIASLRDRAGMEILSGTGGLGRIHTDLSDTWSHNIFDFHAPLGAFESVSIQLVENGPVRKMLRVESQWRSSRMTSEFILYRGKEWLEMRISLDWHEQFQALKLEFPLALEQTSASYEIPFGWIERAANGLEEAGQGWVDLSGKRQGSSEDYGLALLNDGKYSFSAAGSVLEVTALRSPAYANHIPNVLEEGKHYSFIDQGRQDFTLRLLPHAGKPVGAELSRQAAELNQPAILQQASFHPGRMPQVVSFAAVEPSCILLSAVKGAEDGDGLVLRAFNCAETAAEAKLDLPQWGWQVQTRFEPFEVKTFKISANPLLPIRETDLLED
jgi:alpha-mannosidase